MQPSDSTRRFKLLSNQKRLEVLKLLWEQSHSVSSLMGALGIEQSLLSHHLSLLRQEGLVETARQGKEIIYSLAPSVRGKEKHSFSLGCCDIAF